MALSEYELRILRDLEGSLRDFEPRLATIERRMRRRRRHLWLIILGVTAPLAGTGLIALAASTGAGLSLALVGSALLAVPVACVGPLCTHFLRDRRRPKPAGSGPEPS